jgi:hypothetical protein
LIVVSPSILALDVEKLSRDWRWVLGCLREVILQSGEQEIAKLLPLPGEPIDLAPPRDSVRLTQAYSIAFQLLSMAEQNASAQFRSEVEARDGLAGVPALWGESLKRLIDQGWTAEEIARELPSIQVELVLTAHPTEAKRAPCSLTIDACSKGSSPETVPIYLRVIIRKMMTPYARSWPSCGERERSISTNPICNPNAVM